MRMGKPRKSVAREQRKPGGPGLCPELSDRAPSEGKCSRVTRGTRLSLFPVEQLYSPCEPCACSVPADPRRWVRV